MTKTGPRAPHYPADIASRRALAQRLRQIRVDLGMTQLDVAEDIGVSESVISKAESFQIQDSIVANVQRHARGLDRAIRFRLLRLDASDLPEYPHLSPSEADARHRTDLLRQLADVRRARSLSQADVAARMGLYVTAVGKIEATDRELLLSTYQRYARALGGRLGIRVVPAPTVDEVAISLALKGKRAFGELSDAEKVVLFRDHVPANRWSSVRNTLRISNEKARMWQARAQVAA
jgi:transcriptional regulator with XRE-family HTH domain